MKIKLNFKINKRGSVFPTALISLFAMCALSGILYKMTTQDTHLINHMKKATQAEYLAEAGLSEVLGILSADWSAKDSGGNFPLKNVDPGSYDATIVQSNGRVLITSVGTVAGVQRTVSAEVAAPASSALDYAIAGHSVSFTLVGQSHVQVDHGSVYSDTNASLNAQAGSSQIELQAPGQVIAGGSVTTSGAGSITTGTKTSGAPLASWPVPDFNYYKNIAQTNGTYVNGNATYSNVNSLPSPAGRVIFVTGNVTISKAQSTTATIIATGDITVTGGTLSISQPGNYPALMTQNGTITFSGVGNSNPSELTATGLVYSGNNFTVSGNHHHINVQGTILAKGAWAADFNGAAQNHIEVNYVKPNVNGLSSGNGGSMNIKSYTD